MNYFLSLADSPDRRLDYYVNEFRAVQDVYPLVRNIHDERGKDRVDEVLGWLIAHPRVLFVGDAEAFDAYNQQTNGRGRAMYEVNYNQEGYMMDAEINGMCTLVSGRTRYMVVRRVVWGNTAIGIMHFFVNEDRLGLDSLIRKHLIDTFLLENE